ncbi:MULTISPECIES: ATP-binding cassette domain-containing protein [unclassified Colwellia]|jgi:sodium transport system ATP-binding protein|uniref:ABC transporter ATP-binding protein n=1 Tax=unclassified Colwellia TaxID=196834 RepID=UPI0015F6DBCB|nr:MULTISPECIES: ATP-binding cassette domain-containing protein [unclassified Colwellia]MBA6363511.1 ATP-binding cassette domain-containing protein [Colwellia sp. BRX8-8]MBA6339028.1 ATP-binding cassette domain-containing protein [Colwellia sp. BRX8-7]MBA6350198.1 ATP-binding cassette domain-containing protein [Colwellia sp. BRX8-9]MBA6351720.1 ATP-binding cassette domain-containing protein [Colwellia sp. BRX9-1]MBA6356704.1 ATP-binding cassette domain-containing protein [Colwellia sp. BRX8-3]|tara:strand:+ start:1758 stop:2504 length:747 start_codon:yes stop_codon:yes gene_type:complete
MIEVNNLHKSFIDKKNTVKALDGLSFTAKNGEITGILGPNGAGKTTCLRTLYGLLKADEGSVLVDGINVLEDPLAVRQRLGIFPDKFGLYERLTAYEQVDYFASLHGMQGAKKKAAIAQIFKDLEMEELAHRKTVGFSQGQRMKVTLAQALVHQPKNFVLDEPTRGLDVMSTRVLRNHLAKFKEKGHCILFSSHVMQEVAALCDRVIIVSNGKLAAQGTPQELCDLAGEKLLEDAFVKLIGSDEGVAA